MSGHIDGEILCALEGLVEILGDMLGDAVISDGGEEMEGSMDTDGLLHGTRDGELDGGTRTRSEPPHKQHASDTSFQAYTYSLPPTTAHQPV